MRFGASTLEPLLILGLFNTFTSSATPSLLTSPPVFLSFLYLLHPRSHHPPKTPPDAVCNSDHTPRPTTHSQYGNDAAAPPFPSPRHPSQLPLYLSLFAHDFTSRNTTSRLIHVLSLLLCLVDLTTHLRGGELLPDVFGVPQLVRCSTPRRTNPGFHQLMSRSLKRRAKQEASICPSDPQDPLCTTTRAATGRAGATRCVS